MNKNNPVIKTDNITRTVIIGFVTMVIGSFGSLLVAGTVWFFTQYYGNTEARQSSQYVQEKGYYSPREYEMRQEVQSLNSSVTLMNQKLEEMSQRLKDMQNNRFTDQEGEILRKYIDDVDKRQTSRNNDQDARIERQYNEIQGEFRSLKELIGGNGQ